MTGERIIPGGRRRPEQGRIAKPRSGYDNSALHAGESSSSPETGPKISAGTLVRNVMAVLNRPFTRRDIQDITYEASEQLRGAGWDADMGFYPLPDEDEYRGKMYSMTIEDKFSYWANADTPHLQYDPETKQYEIPTDQQAVFAAELGWVNGMFGSSDTQVLARTLQSAIDNTYKPKAAQPPVETAK